MLIVILFITFYLSNADYVAYFFNQKINLYPSKSCHMGIGEMEDNGGGGLIYSIYHMLIFIVLKKKERKKKKKKKKRQLPCCPD
jgi:hypothetical protein